MKAGKNTRSGFGARCAAVLCACAVAASAAAAPAAADTGGASSGASSEAQAGRGIAFSAFRFGGATWYGPGFYGKQTACGQTLRPGTLGVAHRSLPCGTVVKFVFGGRQVVTRVIDRGPYAKGFAWDLTNGTREALGFEGSGQIRYAVAAQYARP
jgi:rare lipoprotein A (peptidoglycan hydrolase)